MRSGRIEAGDERRGGRVGRAVALAAGLIVAITGLSATSASAQDTTPPGTRIIAGPIGPTRDNQPTFTLESSEPNSTFTCKLDALAPVPCGPLFYQPSQPLPEGSHSLFAVATDPSGNADPIGSLREFTIDRSIAGARLAGSTRQRVSSDDLSINVKLGGQEPLTARAEGEVRIGKRRLPTGAIKVAIDNQPTVAAKLTASFKVERAITRALRGGQRVAVGVSATFRDELGNEDSKSRLIVLR